MALILAGTVIGGIVIYNNSDYFVFNGLRAYTLVQDYFNKFKPEESNEDIVKDDIIIKQYHYKNKIFYKLKSENYEEPSEQALEKHSLAMNPILNINLSINDKNYEVTKISDFLFLEKEICLNPESNKKWIEIINIILGTNIIFNEDDKIVWEIMDNGLNVNTGVNLLIKYKDNLEIIKIE